MENLGKNQLLQMKQAFTEFDRTGTGELSNEEIHKFMVPVNNSVNNDDEKRKRQVDDMMDIIDHSGDGKLDFPEFAILMAEKIKDEHYEGELEEAYIHLVKKITNNITKSSMRRTYKQLGEQVTDEELTAVFKELGVKGNEMVFNDFLRVMLEK